MKEIHIADLFCGAGGTSTGALQACAALGRKVKLTAVNHWPRAIETHSANHPAARHLCARIEDVTPESCFKRGELDILWASPECTHFSRARGGAPVDDQRRVGAWRVCDWAERLQPAHIMIENVPEFLDWGPMAKDGGICPKGKGQLFHRWAETLRTLGYKVEWKLLRAADYGDPTTRQRLFVQAVRGRKRIVWPDPTHAQATDQTDLFKSALPAWRPASDIIDWSLDCPSIYTRTKPLAPNTLRRIYAGLHKYGLDKYLIELRGTDSAQLDTSARSTNAPLPTITAGGGEWCLIQPFLTQYYGSSLTTEVSEPLPTVTCQDRFGLVRPILQHNGQTYELDIGYRMLQPHELSAAQGFPADYQFTGTKTEIVRQIGNAVCPGIARALVTAALTQNANVSQFTQAA